MAAEEERWVEREAAPGWFRYLREEALLAGKTLGELVNATLVEGDWRGSTCVPSLTETARLQQYGRSAMGWPKTRRVHGPNVTAWMAERVARCLRDHETATLIIPDAMGEAGGPHVGKLWPHYTTYDDEVYFLLTRDEATPDLVRQAINAAGNAWMEAAMITTVTIQRQPLTSQDLKHVAERTIGILASAYDGETWLLVERQGTR